MEAFAAALAAFADKLRRRRLKRLAFAAAVCVLLLVAGVVLYVKTDHGTIEVRLSDPTADVRVSVDGDEVTLTDGGRVTKLRAGPHALEVKGPDFETQTKVFKVTRGGTTVVEVELKPKGKPVVPPPPPPPSPDRIRLARLLAHGRFLIDAGRFLELGEVADEALRIDPESPGALALRATYRNDRLDADGARADAEAALKLNPETYQALIVRSVLPGVSFDEGIADLTAAIRLRRDSPLPSANRALLYHHRKDYRQAITDATRAIEVADKRPSGMLSSTFLTRGAAHAYLGEYPEALADYAKAAELTPGEPRVFFQRSAVYSRLGDEDKAAADLARARELSKKDLRPSDRPVFPDPPKPPERKPLTPDEARDLEAALGAFDRASRVGNGEASRQAAEEACRIDPTSAAARSARARIRLLDRQTTEALADAVETLRLDPNDAWAYIVRGAARVQQKDPAAGIADLTIAIRLDPANPFAWINRAWAYRVRGQYHQAIADATEAIQLRPNFDPGYDMRGTCYAHLGEYEKARADYEAAVKIQPTSARWWRAVAAVRARVGDVDGAQAARETALKYDKGVADRSEPKLPTPIPPVKRDPELQPADATPGR